MNMARSLLSIRKLSKYYWTEAVACSVYILNRSPTSIVQGKVPKEKWSGLKVIVSHFRIFGCAIFAHVPEELRKKLDDRSEMYIFIVYSEQSKAYRLYNRVTKKFLVSRDVKLIEDKSWNGMENITSHNPFIKLDEHEAPTMHLPRLQVQIASSSSSHCNSNSAHKHKRITFLRILMIKMIMQHNLNFSHLILLFLMKLQRKKNGQMQ